MQQSFMPTPLGQETQRGTDTPLQSRDCSESRASLCAGATTPIKPDDHEKANPLFGKVRATIVRRKYLKIAITADYYSELSIAADRAGMKLSPYVRWLIAQGQYSSESDQAVSRIEAKIDAKTSVNMAGEINAMRDILEPVLVEVLLLVRELIAERNAQVLNRVGQKVNSRYPNRSAP